VAPVAPPRARARQPRPGSRGPSGPDRASIIPAIVALVLTLAMQQLISSAVPADAYVYRLFRPAGGWIMGVVPALIAFAFIWTLTDLALKFRVARVNERDLVRREVLQLPVLVTQEPLDVTLQRLRGWEPVVLSRPVGRRVQWLLQHLESVDSQRAHELMRHQSDLEADSAASGYRTVKLFIWAMPILGFIGTVLGISLAVGGFSEFLTTNVSIDQVDQVTAELGEVASGLSFAFDTTLLGLLAGLVASVVSSGVQSREERLLTHIDEMGLRIMENSASVGARPVSPVQALGAEAEAFNRMMRARLEELSTQMAHFTRAVQTGLDGFLGEWSRLPPEVARVAADLHGLREHLATAAKSTDQLILETRVLLEGLNEASSGMSSRLATSIGSISQTVEGLGESLEGVSGTLAQRMTALSERLTASDGQLHSALSGLQDSVDRNLEGTAAATRSQTATEQALQRLADSLTDLGDRIAEVRDAQAALAPVLKQLSGPMELRLMPAGVMAATPRHDAR
jgi:hypothetical protein